LSSKTFYYYNHFQRRIYLVSICSLFSQNPEIQAKFFPHFSINDLAKLRSHGTGVLRDLELMVGFVKEGDDASLVEKINKVKIFNFFNILLAIALFNVNIYFCTFPSNTKFNGWFSIAPSGVVIVRFQFVTSLSGGVERKSEIVNDDEISMLGGIPVLTFPIKNRINTELLIDR